jgi:hypothetical protein
MFQWRMKLRVADEAFRNGRLDEAGRLLCEAELRDFLPAKQLLARVAAELAKRAERRIDEGQSSAGWRDLEDARHWGADAQRISTLKQQLVDQRVREATSYLAAGEPAAALARLEKFISGGDTCRPVALVRDAAGHVAAAQRLCRCGEFARAEAELSAAATLLPDVKPLDDAHRACRVKGAECRRLSARLHEAMTAERWTEALAVADELLELCCDYEPARDARRRAWAMVGMRTCSVRGADNGARLGNGRPPVNLRIKSMDDVVPAPLAEAAAKPAMQPGASISGKRFLLWIDGVGGYLVCTADDVVLGQPVRDSRVDIPILGDVSRRHARIRRDGEGYLIEPLRGVRINGRPIERPTALADGMQIDLGNAVRLVFRRPHPLSRTAVLTFLSHHRTQPAADAILLMAESCVLGPTAQSHVHCRDAASDVVLYRQGDELWCRATGKMQVDGTPVSERARLAARSQVVGEDFSLSVEPLEG